MTVYSAISVPEPVSITSAVAPVVESTVHQPTRSLPPTITGFAGMTTTSPDASASVMRSVAVAP